MKWQEIPVFIINRDNLERGFRRQVEWLLDAGSTNVNVIDNASTYPPLLEYYKDKSFSFNLIRKDKNLGPWVFWETKMYELVKSTPYIVSDSDVAPTNDCPKDLIERLLFVQEKHPKEVLKVGPGLSINRIPDSYKHKKKVIDHETQFSLEAHRVIREKSSWVVENTPEMFEAIIDTTFALYKAGEENYSTDWCLHYRLDKPYVFEHVPWQENSSEANEEREYYLTHANIDWCHW